MYVHALQACKVAFCTLVSFLCGIAEVKGSFMQPVLLKYIYFQSKKIKKFKKKCTKWSSTGFIVMQNMFIEILIPKIQHLKYIPSLLATKAAAQVNDEALR